MFYGLVLLAIFSLAYSLSGGLKAVAMTDGVQVILLIFGGLAVSFIALNIISESNGVMEGMRIVMNEMPEKFDMVLSSDNSSYKDLPVFGYYWDWESGLDIFSTGVLINILHREH